MKYYWALIHAPIIQIRLFYPEAQHPAFGAIRAIVKDDTDNETGAAAQVFLDSDDVVGASSGSIMQGHTHLS